MGAVVIDTGVLIVVVDIDDQHHSIAMEIVCGMDHGDLPTGRVANYIILETLNPIHNGKHHAKAFETYARLDQSSGSRCYTRPRRTSPGLSSFLDLRLIHSSPRCDTGSAADFTNGRLLGGRGARSAQKFRWRSPPSGILTSIGFVPPAFTVDSPEQAVSPTIASIRASNVIVSPGCDSGSAISTTS